MHQRHMSFVGAAMLGALLASPWWMQSWQALQGVDDARVSFEAQQKSIQTLRAQMAVGDFESSHPKLSWVDVTVFTQGAQQQGLQMSQMGLGKTQTNPTLAAMHLQQVPLQFNVRGSWKTWLDWLSQWPTSAPGVTVASLELKANSEGGISAHVTAWLPQFVADVSTQEGMNSDAQNETSADPFNAAQWTQRQHAYAMQHPSYARVIAPELLRLRDPLEMFAHERLKYVGQITTDASIEALVRVMPPTAGHKDMSMMPVHRVRVGEHLGHNFGKVMTIQPDQLVVQELVLAPTGEWQARELRMPLVGESP